MLFATGISSIMFVLETQLVDCSFFAEICSDLWNPIGLELKFWAKFHYRQLLQRVPFRQVFFQIFGSKCPLKTFHLHSFCKTQRVIRQNQHRT